MAKELDNYKERIITDPAVLVGKPVVKGTRIAVETVLAHLAENPDMEDLFGAYPRLTLADVKACLAFAEAQVRKTPKARQGGQRPPTHPSAI